MKYLMLIYGNEEKRASFPAEAWPEAIAKQDAFNKWPRRPPGPISPGDVEPVADQVAAGSLDYAGRDGPACS